MNVKLLTFDLDDTLWHCEPVMVQAEQTLYRWLSQNCPQVTACYDPVSLRKLKKVVLQRDPTIEHNVSAIRKATLEYALLETGYTSAEAAECAIEAFEIFLSARQQVSLFDDAIGVLERLSQRYSLAALTNGNADIHRIGLGRYFKFALSAELVGSQKPDPHMFEHALKKAKVCAEEVIHIGDDPENDVLGASRLGIETIWVNIFKKEWPLEIDFGVEVNRLSELPQAVKTLMEKSE